MTWYVIFCAVVVGGLCGAYVWVIKKLREIEKNERERKEMEDRE